MGVRQTQIQYVYGIGDNLLPLPPQPIVSTRDPRTSDFAQPGTVWINSTEGTIWMLATITSNSANWQTSPASGIGIFTSVQVTTGDLDVDQGDVNITLGDLTVAAGNTTLAGTLDVAGLTTLAGGLSVAGPVIISGDFDVTDTGSISLTSTNNAANAILVRTNGGTAETLHIQSSQGTGTGSVFVESTNGGVNVSGGLATINAVNINSTNAAGGITLAGGTAGLALGATNGAVAITSGTGAINIGADAAAHTITLGNSTGATSVVINAGTGALNIGTNAIAHTITMGNTTGATAVAINAGTGGIALGSASTGDITLTSADTVLIDSAGVLELNSSGAAISIGNDAVAQAINVGTGAAARTVTVGNVTGATAVNVNAGTGGINLSSAGIFTLDAVADTQASPSATSVIAANVGAATFTGFTTAAAATQVFTITNSLVSATSQIICSASNEGSNDAQMTVTRINRGSGTFNVSLKNNGAAALNGNITITFMVLN